MAKPFLRDHRGNAVRPNDIVTAAKDFHGRAPATMVSTGSPLGHHIEAGTQGIFTGFAPGASDLGIVAFETEGGETVSVEVEGGWIFKD